MFGAVSAHKYIIAFCIGVELLASGTKRWLSLVYIFTFSFMSALGIGVGILLVGGAGAADAGLYSVVLQVCWKSFLFLIAYYISFAPFCAHRRRCIFFYFTLYGIVCGTA